jgi:hypothetical protein
MARLVPYDKLETGFEAVYIETKPEDLTGAIMFEDESGKWIRKWSLWNCRDNPEQWDDEIRLLNSLQEALGALTPAIRRVRAHIASLTPCDSGLPVTVDEVLGAIGKGMLAEPSFHNGCWNSDILGEAKTSQPRHIQSVETIHHILTGYLAGDPEDRFVQKYPHAKGFVHRTYQWLGPVAKLTELRQLLLERMLLPFDFFTKASRANPLSTWPDNAEAVCREVMSNCYEDGGRGAAIDAKIAALEGLPRISMMYPQQAYQAQIDNPEKKDLYVLCCSLAHGLHTLGDCHHSTFRWIENWVYSIGTGKWGIPTRKIGTERQRVGRLLFGYLLGLDKWLLGIPMQFLLLDLAHVDFGFDPKNEIIRVYAHLGEEKKPVKEWLAASLWHSLMYGTGGLAWRDKHQDFIENSRQAGISIREWMDFQLKEYESSR